MGLGWFYFFLLHSVTTYRLVFVLVILLYLCSARLPYCCYVVSLLSLSLCVGYSTSSYVWCYSLSLVMLCPTGLLVHVLVVVASSYEVVISQL